MKTCPYCLAETIPDQAVKCRFCGEWLETQIEISQGNSMGLTPSLSPRETEPPLSMPVAPVLQAALQALYAGGPKTGWKPDLHNRPQYTYQTKNGHITIFFECPPDATEAVIALWEVVQDLSVETADVFLILMARIAQLLDPRRDIARMRLEEIAEYRAVRVRDGSIKKLHADFKQEVLRLADLRLTMVWRDYKGGGTVTFGKERPDRLLDIVDVEYENDGQTWKAFGFRCGQAFAHFLAPDGLRWIGCYSRALLQLNPYHEAFTKKVGTYWTILGTIAGKRGALPRATLGSILAFCHEEPNWKRPTRTVEKCIEAHNRLHEIGLLKTIPDLEPKDRLPGFLQKWLDETYEVELAKDLLRMSQAEKKAKLPSPRKRRISKHTQCLQQQLLPVQLPENPQLFQTNPARIREFRVEHNFRQAELARALGITQEALSRYERGIRKLPENIAVKILAMWQQNQARLGSISSPPLA